MTIQALLITTVIYSGSVTTKEAEKTGVILNNLMNDLEPNETQKIDFIYLMTQIRSRNLNIQNKFFKLNWNVFLSVSTLTQNSKYKNTVIPCRLYQL